MKSIKKIAIILLALTCVPVFASCKQQSDDEPVASSESSSAEEVSVDELVEESPTEEITEPASPEYSFPDDYTVDEYGYVRDSLGIMVSQIDIDTYEGSIIIDSMDEDSEEEIVLTNMDFTYEILQDDVDGDNIVKITGYLGNDEQIIIPKEIDEKPVAVIGENAFYDNNNIKSVFISNTIKRIETDAFYNCENLSEIRFEEDSVIRSLYTECFAKTAITEIIIPQSCISMADDIFEMCYNLEKLTILGMDTKTPRGMFLTSGCTVYAYKGSIASKTLISVYGYNFVALDEE